MDQGQFFPYFIITISALVTLPLSYSLLKPDKGQDPHRLLVGRKQDEPLTDRIDIEDTAPRIKSNFKPADDALIQGQKRKQWRRERRLKRIIAAVMGYLTMAWMLYLIMVTKTTAPKIWDPYSILGISRVTTNKTETGFRSMNTD